MTAGDLSTVIEDVQPDLDRQEVEDEEELATLLSAFEISHFGQVSTQLEVYHFAITYTSTTALIMYVGSYWIKLARYSA